MSETQTHSLADLKDLMAAVPVAPSAAVPFPHERVEPKRAAFGRS